jgi:hypothetical protein
MPDHLKKVKLSFPSQKSEGLKSSGKLGLDLGLFLQDTTPVSFRAEVLGFRAKHPWERAVANK